MCRALSAGKAPCYSVGTNSSPSASRHPAWMGIGESGRLDNQRGERYY